MTMGTTVNGAGHALAALFKLAVEMIARWAELEAPTPMEFENMMLDFCDTSLDILRPFCPAAQHRVSPDADAALSAFEREAASAGFSRCTISPIPDAGCMRH